MVKNSTHYYIVDNTNTNEILELKILALENELKPYLKDIEDNCFNVSDKSVKKILNQI